MHQPVVHKKITEKSVHFARQGAHCAWKSARCASSDGAMRNRLQRIPLIPSLTATRADHVLLAPDHAW